MTNLEELKQNLIAEIEKRVDDRILEKQNAELLTKLINNADNQTEARNIAMLGTTYKRTGFHFDKRLEKMSDEIHYLAKNQALSFENTQNGGGSKHKLIIGDNYPALQNLLISYKNKIKVIYIDPPYGKDSMGEFAKTNYDNAITRDNLLSSLYPRLMLAKDLLSDDGVIFCSIDDKNQAYIKCLFDEIFGESNFLVSIPRITSAQRPAQENYVSTQHDYILAYAKNKNYSYFNKIIKRDLTNIKADSIGRYFDGDTSPILASSTQGYSAGGDYDFEYNGKIYQPLDSKGNRRRWLWTIERMEAAAKLGILVETKTTLRVKNYINKEFQVGTNIMVDKVENLNATSFDLMNSNFTNDRGTTEINKIGFNNFQFPKPVDLIKFCLELATDKNSIILDFYAGSGTTGHAVLELNKSDGGNRQFILCTNNEITEMNPNGIAYDVTSKRLKRIMTGECYDGTKPSEWLKNNEPYGDNLEVLEIKSAPNKVLENSNPFELIDETLYGKEKFETLSQKIKWICENFENTQKYLENGDE